MKIDFETHFVTQGWVDALTDYEGYPRFEVDPVSGVRRFYDNPDSFEPCGDLVMSRLLDLGVGRIRAMDAAGIDVAVLSLTSPGVEILEPKLGSLLARATNDELAEAIHAFPGRYEGFAALAPKDPIEAAKELERAVRDLGLRGWKTHSNFGDSYLDDKRYWPVLAKAAQLGVPVYLHPATPMIPDLQTYGLALAGAAFGFGVDVALCMVRLVLSGVFDAFPTLKVILGHYGEGLPFQMQRIDHPFVRPHVLEDAFTVPDLARRPSEYLRDNMWVSTSGNYLPAAFNCTVEALGIDKILLGTDYPYEEMTECIEFLEQRGLGASETAKVYHENARSIGFGPVLDELTSARSPQG